MFSSIHTSRTDQAGPAVFLDRDGTINVEKNYLCHFEDWEWIPGAKEAIRALKQSGYKVVVVSNQAGIARGMFKPSDVERLHSFLQQELTHFGATIDAFYYCPHHPDFNGNCSCRKPAPGMLIQASLDLNLDFARSWMIGDKFIDVQAGRAASVQSVMVRTGYGVSEQKYIDRKTQVFDSLVYAIRHIVGNQKEYEATRK
jgi:D-glycero-D-manno-heptose 1,7-bisphosphate phosphatase